MSITLYKNLNHPSLHFGSAILFTSLSVLVAFRIGLDSTLTTVSGEELYVLNQSRSYFPSPLGKIFENKITLAASKLGRNFFFSLDPNIYFFAGHPRERAGIGEFEKFSWVFMPLFFWGLCKIFHSRKFIPLGSYVSVVTVLNTVTSQAGAFGLVFSFPVISALAATGLTK